MPLTDTVTLHFQIGKGIISFQDIAKKLNMSERTLRERLSKEGSSYRQIKNRYVFQQSLNLLNNPGLSIENIADTLGYSETCAFSRAFEKMTGMSPGRYRRNIITNQTAGKS